MSWVQIVYRVSNGLLKDYELDDDDDDDEM